jgi:hypothetical protein
MSTSPGSARTAGPRAELAARLVLFAVGVFLLLLGAHEALYATELTTRLAGWGLVAGGLSGLVAFPAPSVEPVPFPMREAASPRLVLPAFCGLIGFMTGAYLVAAIHTPPGGPPDAMWVCWAALAALSGIAGGIVLVRRRSVFRRAGERPGLAIGSALTALASVVALAQFARDTVYEPSKSGASVALDQRMQATRIDDGRVRLTLELEAKNVSDRRVAVVGSLCTVTGTDLRRTPRLGSDRGLLRRALGAGQPLAGQPAGAVTRGAQEDGGVVVHSMRPTSDGLYLEPEEPWSLSRVVVVPATGDPELYRWRCQLSVAKGGALLRRDPPEDWHQKFGGLASDGVLGHLIDRPWTLRTVEERLRIAEPSLLRRWAHGRRYIAWRRTVGLEAGQADVPALDELLVYVDRIGRARDSAMLDRFDIYVADQYGLVVAEGIAEVPAPPGATRPAPDPPAPRRLPLGKDDRARVAAALESAGPVRAGVDLLPGSVAVAAWDGRRYAIARGAAPYSSMAATFASERGRPWRLVGVGVCAGAQDAGVPMPVWRAWKLLDGPGEDCLMPARNAVVPRERLDRVDERWMPRGGDAVADEAPLASPGAVRSTLYGQHDPAGPRALRRLENEGFWGGRRQNLQRCPVPGQELPCDAGYADEWRYVLVLASPDAARDEVEATAREIRAGAIGEAAHLDDIGVPGAWGVTTVLGDESRLGAAAFAVGRAVYGIQVRLEPRADGDPAELLAAEARELHREASRLAAKRASAAARPSR